MLRMSETTARNSADAMCPGPLRSHCQTLMMSGA